VRRAALREGIDLAGPVLDRIVERSQGDLRAALNDLDAVAPLPHGTDAGLLLGHRDQSGEVAAMLQAVLASPRFYRSVEIRDRVDVPPDEILPWAEEAVARSRVPAAQRDAAFGPLSAADRFLVRARRQRVYSLWSYAGELLTGGVAVRLQAPAGAIGVGFPAYLGAMGRSRAARAVRTAALAKMGPILHVSRHKALESFWPLLERLAATYRAEPAGRAARWLARIVTALDLSMEEIALVLDRDPDDPAVVALAALGREPEPAPPTVPDVPGDAEGSEPASRRRVQRRLGEY